MTYEQIIRILNYCKDDDCDNCPIICSDCCSNLAGLTLDLVKRQQTEIAQKDKQIEELVSFQRFCEKKAIKEFADKLIEIGTQDGAYDYVSVFEIDNLKKKW